MDRVLVLQSFRDGEVPRWVSRCMASVRVWCNQRGYRYRYENDALFERLPDWCRAKLEGRGPILADLARLLWIRDCLAEGEWDMVAWLDADVYVFAPVDLRLSLMSTCQFGEEVWLQPDGTSARSHRNVHNAYCAFRPDCVVLPFLIDTVQRILQKVAPERIAPQMVGPKLLTSLHSIAGFDLEPSIGAISPMLADELRGEAGPARAKLAGKLRMPLKAANLCASLQLGQETEMQSLMDVLDGFSSGLK